MTHHFYAMLSRMKNIYRWGLMKNIKRESLGEHSLETAYIAHALALIHNRRFGGNIDANFIATAAMFHDTSEILTGDMPTPVKYYNNDIKSVYKKIEKAADDKLLSLLPEDLKPDLCKLYNLDEKAQKFIKAADKISALIKCTEELNLGNQEFSKAKESTLAAINEMNMPEATVFLEEFLESYSLSIDEQL